MTQQKVTISEFEGFLRQPANRDRLWDLIDGEIVEKVRPEEHGIIVINIAFALKSYLLKNPGGRIGTRIAHRVAGDDHNYRHPDLSFIRDPDQAMLQRGAVPTMPDLAIEVKAADDTFKELRDKATYYLANGTRMVWLVYPEKKIVEVWTPTTQQLLTETDVVGGGDILPGFQLAVGQIFVV